MFCNIITIYSNFTYCSDSRHIETTLFMYEPRVNSIYIRQFNPPKYNRTYLTVKGAKVNLVALFSLQKSVIINLNYIVMIGIFINTIYKPQTSTHYVFILFKTSKFTNFILLISPIHL